MITPELLQAILEQYSLPVYGIHGVTHWARVLENGRLLAEKTGANPDVIALFAVFHDSRRQNEDIDPGHGRRGANLAVSMRERWIDLPDADFQMLVTACANHTAGSTRAAVTVQVCWDADRLDLLRVGIWPNPRKLCTEAARDPALIEWANTRARNRFVPEFVKSEWGLDHARR